MTNEQINIAIAEACGIVGPFENRWIRGYEMEGGDAYGLTGFKKDELVFVADYFNDLNAMHKAEEVMTEMQRCDYSEHLYELARNHQEKTGKWRFVSMNAAQRAEAFLRTIGKWEVEND